MTPPFCSQSMSNARVHDALVAAHRTGRWRLFDAAQKRLRAIGGVTFICPRCGSREGGCTTPKRECPKCRSENPDAPIMFDMERL